MIERITLVMAIGILYFWFLGTLSKNYVADIMNVRAENALSTSSINKSIEYSNKAILYNPNEPAYYKQRAKALISSTAIESYDNEQKTFIKEKALDDLTIALELNPNNLATLRNTAPLYFFLANKDLTKPSTIENIDEDYLPISREYFKQMQEYVPNDVGVQVLSAKYQKRLNLEEDYQESITKIKELRPDLLDWYLVE